MFQQNIFFRSKHLYFRKRKIFFIAGYNIIGISLTSSIILHSIFKIISLQRKCMIDSNNSATNNRKKRT